MEEYEPHIAAGHIVYAGVDYGKILEEAEKEADVILWDGGNNDLPFYKPDLYIVVTDPLRPGHEEMYHPGAANVRMADVAVINKVDIAKPDDVEEVRKNVRRMNPEAVIIEAESPVFIENENGRVKNKKVLVVEDGPTLTHGGMAYGAGYVAARQYGAGEIVDPRPYGIGTIKKVFENFPHLKEILPAMGYGHAQMEELKNSINAIPADLVIVGTPIDLAEHLHFNKPSLRVTYSLKERTTPGLKEALKAMLKEGVKIGSMEA
jgi:predicted GTPase